MSVLKKFDPASEYYIKNLLLVGSPGSGKSTTCNTIYGKSSSKDRDGKREPFQETNEEFSHKQNTQDELCEDKKINLIDTPALGSQQFSSRGSEIGYKFLDSVFSQDREKVSNQVDAFILVVRLIPCAQTLKNDLLMLRECFGPKVFKSLVLLLIYQKETKTDEIKFLAQLQKMDEVVRIISEGKGEKANENWFCLWDNFNPREKQEENLFKKLENLKPYTYKDFTEYTRRKEEQQVMGGINNEEESTTKEEEQEEETEQDKDNNKENSFLKLFEFIDSKHEAYERQVRNYLKQTEEEFKSYLNKIDDLASEEKEIKKNKKTGKLLFDCTCRRRKLKRQEKKELAGNTIGKGTKEGVKSGAEEFFSKTTSEFYKKIKENSKE